MLIILGLLVCIVPLFSLCHLNTSLLHFGLEIVLSSPASSPFCVVVQALFLP